MLVGVLSDALNHRLRQLDQQQAVVARVVAKYVGKRRRENDAESKLSQCPGRVLARGTATEVLACDQHGRRAEVLLVEYEVFAVAAIRMVSPVEKQELPKARALDALEVLLGDDLIGIDVLAIQRRHHATMFANRLHRASSCTPSRAHRRTARPRLRQLRLRD